MSIPVICTVCRASMRVGDGFTEPKKIRCTGCGTLMLLTPDPTSASGVAISFPRKKDKQTGMSETTKRIILYTIFGAMCLFFGYALWMSIGTVATRGAVDGNVTLDGENLAKGKIRFESIDGKFNATAEIRQGHYSIAVKSGPGLGPNKVKITSIEKTESGDIDRIPARFNEIGNPQNQVTVKSGSNSLSFAIRTK